MQNTAKAIMEETGEPIEAVDDIVTITLEDMPSAERLTFIAQHSGDLSPFLSEHQIASISAQCMEDYETDETGREKWRKKAEESLKRAMQEPEPEKVWPWKGASNASYPILTTASLQFAARAYPAIVRGDEAVSCKVVGSDKGLPQLGSDGQQLMQIPEGIITTVNGAPVLVDPQTMQAQPIPPEALEGIAQAAQPVWQRAPGVKTKRAQRVKEFMNYTIFYRMKGWEKDTDTMLHHLPIIGCGFRKVFFSGGQRSEYVPALKLVAPMDAKSCEQSPRLTEVQEGKSLNDIIGLQRQGFYRDVALVENEDDAGLRCLLEQHCLIDLDDDGYAEPYVVTLDKETQSLLRIEANFSPDDVVLSQTDAGVVVSEIRRECYYVKYDFFPSLDGTFYGLGLGHLLDNITTIVNNTINQMIDSGTAAAAGGGFIASGVDLTGGGKRNSRITFEPGAYKTVNVSGSKLREAMVERTFPGPNPVTFQILEMMLGAAERISATSEVLTGEAKNTGQVGTTMALIEQGLQVFTAIYKRIYGSLKEEFEKLYANIGRYGGEQAQADYLNILDDPAADFAADFDADDFDIRPVSDPSNVTKLQKLSRAQFLGTFLGAPGVNPQAIIRRMWEAADVDDIDELFAEPQQPDPMQVAMAQGQVEKIASEVRKNDATAQKTLADIGNNQDKTAIAAEEQQRRTLEGIADRFQQGLDVGARVDEAN